MTVDNRYQVNSDKLFLFLSYQAFRDQRPRGGKKKRGGASDNFNAAEYESVRRTYDDHVRKRRTDENYVIPDPKNPLGFSQINTYCSTVRNIWSEQVANNANSLAWDLVHDARIKEIMSMCKKRTPRIKRARYDEKLDDQFSPFQSIEQLEPIEAWFWGQGKKSRQGCFTSLRARCTLLWCYTGVLRSESLFLGELSDLVDFRAQRKQHSDPMEVTVMQMHTGKTIDSDKRQYGRALRHIDPCRCAVGALGLYLLYRFDYSGEMEDGKRPDFTDNSSWFDIKILTDGSDANNRKEMRKRSYTDKIKECFHALLIFACAFGHWGRISAPPKMELEELPQDMIRAMGTYVVVCCVCRLCRVCSNLLVGCRFR